MPQYLYRCPFGHETELLRPREVEEVQCICGQTASRQAVYRIAFTGFSRMPIDQRPIKIGNFLEASAQNEYDFHKAENEAGHELQPPPLWETAKKEAKRLRSLGVKDSADMRTTP